MLELFSNILNITWQQAVMWVIGGVLIYLAIAKDMEPTLLLPMGFGAILVNRRSPARSLRARRPASSTCSSARASPTSCSRCFCSSASAQ